MVFFWKEYVLTEKKLHFFAAIGQAKFCSLKYKFRSLAGIMFNVMMVWHKEKKIKSRIDQPYVATALAVDALHSVPLCQPEGAPCP